MYIYEERGLDKTGETNRELDCEYLFLFLCGFCCLDGIAGVLPDNIFDQLDNFFGDLSLSKPEFLVAPIHFSLI